MPSVTFLAACPAKWKVLSVIWVDGSPIDCPATTPTASPGSIIDLRYLTSIKAVNVFFVRSTSGALSLSLKSWSGLLAQYAFSTEAKFSEVAPIELPGLYRANAGSPQSTRPVFLYLFIADLWYSVAPPSLSFPNSSLMLSCATSDRKFSARKPKSVKCFCFVTSRPSSPYKNCIMLPSASLTVVSYSDLKPSMPLMIHLCRYPDLDVFTAVSIKPSRPAMA